MTARTSIGKALVEHIKSELNGTKPDTYFTNIYDCVSLNTFKFEEIKEFPYIGVHIGSETFQYQPSRQQWIFLDLSILIYDKDTGDIQEQLEKLIADIKTIIDSEDDLDYTIIKPDGSTLDAKVTQKSLNSVSTDEGLLSPYGFAEVSVTFRYAPYKRMY